MPARSRQRAEHACRHGRAADVAGADEEDADGHGWHPSTGLRLAAHASGFPAAGHRRADGRRHLQGKRHRHVPRQGRAVDSRRSRGGRHDRGLASRQEEGARFLQRHPQDVPRRPHRAQCRPQGAGTSRAEIRGRGHGGHPEHRPAARAGRVEARDPHARPRRRDPLHELRHGDGVRRRSQPRLGLPALQGGGRTPAQHRLVRRDADAHGRDRRGAGALRPVPGDRHLGRGLSGGRLRDAGPPPQPRAHTVELNLEPTDNQTLFHEHIYGPATLTVPPYVERVLANGWK